MSKLFLIYILSTFWFISSCSVSKNDKKDYLNKITLYETMREEYYTGKINSSNEDFYLRKQIELLHDISELKTIEKWSVSDTLKNDIIESLRADTTSFHNGKNKNNWTEFDYRWYEIFKKAGELDSKNRSEKINQLIRDETKKIQLKSE